MSSRVRRQAASMTVVGRKAPMTAMQMASRKILKRRQQWRGRSGGVAERRGGSVQHLVGVVFDEQGGDDVGEQPSSCEAGVLGRQLIEVELAFVAFEGGLDRR